MTCYFAQFFKDDSLIFVKQNMFLDLRVSVPLWECILKSYFPTFQLFEKRPLKQENTRADIWQRIYLEEKMIDEWAIVFGVNPKQTWTYFSFLIGGRED